MYRPIHVPYSDIRVSMTKLISHYLLRSLVQGRQYHTQGYSLHSESLNSQCGKNESLVGCTLVSVPQQKWLSRTTLAWVKKTLLFMLGADPKS